MLRHCEFCLYLLSLLPFSTVQSPIFLHARLEVAEGEWALIPVLQQVQHTIEQQLKDAQWHGDKMKQTLTLGEVVLQVERQCRGFDLCAP